MHVAHCEVETGHLVECWQRATCVFPACLGAACCGHWACAVCGPDVVQLLRIISILTYLWSLLQTTNVIQSFGANTISLAFCVTSHVRVCSVHVWLCMLTPIRLWVFRRMIECEMCAICCHLSPGILAKDFSYIQDNGKQIGLEWYECWWMGVFLTAGPP